MHLIYLMLLYPMSAMGAWNEISELESIYRYHFPLAKNGNRFSKDALIASKKKLVELSLKLVDPAERAQCHYLLSLIEWNVCADEAAAKYSARIAMNLNGHRGARDLFFRLEH